MRPSWRSASLPVLLLLLAACGGGQHLQPITPIEGSRTREGGTIQPLDSTRTREIRPLHPGERTIAPLDSARSIRPLEGAAPAREIVPLNGEVIPLDGTIWVGSNHEGAITFEFLVGGILRYSTAHGTWTNGTWLQEGNTVTMEMNDHYADYSGQIRGTRLSGTGHNRAGARWDWRADRQ